MDMIMRIMRIDVNNFSITLSKYSMGIFHTSSIEHGYYGLTRKGLHITKYHDLTYSYVVSTMLLNE
jgi:hypothetical protein